MRRTLAAIAVVILAFVTALPGQTIDYSKKPLQSERSRSFDARHYLIKLRLDLDRKSFEGAATVTLSSFRDGLEACVLDAEEFTVTSVVDDYGTPLRVRAVGKGAHGRPFPAGQVRRDRDLHLRVQRPGPAAGSPVRR